MKHSLLLPLLLIAGWIIPLSSQATELNSNTEQEQNNTLKNITNTLKERITLQGYVQAAYTYDDAGNKKANSFELKRAILMARGKITDHWSCYFMYSFANTGKILEAHTEYHFLPELSVRLGQFKTAFTLENQLSPSTVELINIYSQATSYLAGYNSSDPLYGSNSGRDLGILFYGDLFHGLLNYNFAVMNGQGINKKDGNNFKDIVGKLTVHPLNWVTLGGSFVRGRGCAVTTSDVNPTLQAGDNYTRNRWSAGAIFAFKPIDLRTEYLEGRDGSVRSNGYYLTAAAHVLPKFDVILSYDYFNRNKVQDDKQTNYVAGVQWWFYPKCRLQIQYTYCDPHHGSHSNLLQTQVQVRF